MIWCCYIILVCVNQFSGYRFICVNIACRSIFICYAKINIDFPCFGFVVRVPASGIRWHSVIRYIDIVNHKFTNICRCRFPNSNYRCCVNDDRFLHNGRFFSNGSVRSCRGVKRRFLGLRACFRRLRGCGGLSRCTSSHRHARSSKQYYCNQLFFHSHFSRALFHVLHNIGDSFPYLILTAYGCYTLSDLAMGSAISCGICIITRIWRTIVFLPVSIHNSIIEADNKRPAYYQLLVSKSLNLCPSCARRSARRHRPRRCPASFPCWRCRRGCPASYTRRGPFRSGRKRRRSPSSSGRRPRR